MAVGVVRLFTAIIGWGRRVLTRGGEFGAEVEGGLRAYRGPLMGLGVLVCGMVAQGLDGGGKKVDSRGVVRNSRFNTYDSCNYVLFFELSRVLYVD